MENKIMDETKNEESETLTKLADKPPTEGDGNVGQDKPPETTPGSVVMPIDQGPPTEQVPTYRGKLITDMDQGELWQALKVLRPSHPLSKVEPDPQDAQRTYSLRVAVAEIVGGGRR